MISYILIIFNGDIGEMTSKKSRMTWLEEWLLVFTWMKLPDNIETLRKKFGLGNKNKIYSIV